jgi:hypothetical protein
MQVIIIETVTVAARRRRFRLRPSGERFCAGLAKQELDTPSELSVKYYHDFKYPDPREPAFAGDSASMPEALGETIVWFEELDEQLSTAISFLLRRGDTVGQIVTAELSFKGKVNLLATLFRHEAPQSTHLDQLEKLAGACFQAEEKRNQVVHSKWRNQLEGSGMTRSKYTARGKNGLRHQSETLTPAQVQAIAHHCGYLAHCIDELMYWEFGREYGEP